MACPFVFAITKPFLHFKMQKGFFTSKTKGRSSASRFLRRRLRRRYKRAPTIAFALTQKIVNFTT
jgi:hypothetical protein